MPPQTDGSIQPPPPPEAYDFIVNYHKSSSPLRLFQFNNKPLKTRLALALGGGLSLIIIISVLVALLSGNSTSGTSSLLSLIQQQSTIANLAASAAQNASLQPTQNFAMTTNLSVLSQQQSFINFLHNIGISASNNTQAANNQQLMAKLQNAQSNGSYDQTYISLAQAELNNYKNSLAQTFTTTNNLAEKQLLQNTYDQVKLLLQQSTQNE
jgi:hypothetical protein